MKKFTSILCALVIALSASAAPQFKSMKASQTKHSIEMAKKMIADGTAKKARFQKAATTITAVDCTAAYDDYESAFVYTLTDADGVEYYFAFNGTTDPVVSGTTYTLDDMVADATYWMDWGTWDYGQFTAVTFVKTVDEKGGYTIAITATDENGTQFVINYEFKVSGEAVVIECAESVDAPVYYEDGDWYFGGHNADYEFYLDIYGAEASMVGEYAFSDFYADYTLIYDLEKEVKITAKDAKASITAGTNDTLKINAEILGSDGVKYVIKAFYAAPSAQVKETVTADLKIVKGEYEYGYYTYDKYTFTANDGKNKVEIMWIDAKSVGSYLGDFTVADLNVACVTPAGKDYSNAASGNITIASAEGKITLTGTILCFNNVEYTLNLTYVKPDPQEFNVTMNSGLKYTDAVAKEGWWQLYGSNDTYYITLSNSEDLGITEAPGTYAVADLDATYTYLQVIETEEKIVFTEGSITLAVSVEGVVTAVGSFKDADGNTYKINLTYTDPTAESVVNISIPSGATYENYASYGLYGFYGYAADGSYVQLGIWTDALEGTFTEDDLDSQYVGSYLKIGGAQVDIFAADITLATQDADLVLTAELLCYNNTQYNVTLIVPGKYQGIENAQAASKTTKRIENGQLLIEKNGKTFNVNGAIVK
jgi:hypothetical protein